MFKFALPIMYGIITSAAGIYATEHRYWWLGMLLVALLVGLLGVFLDE